MNDVNKAAREAIAARVRSVAVDVIDAKEPKTPISECHAEGGPEHCRYHKQFIHKEGAGLHSYYNTRLVITKKGKRVYVDSGAKENQEHLTEKQKKDGVRSSTEFGRKVYTDGKEHSRKAPKGMHTKYVLLPVTKEKEPTPNFDSFKGVKADERVEMSEFKDEELYLRSAEPLHGVEKKNGKQIAVKKDGEPTYEWTLNGKKIPKEEALRLEGSLGELALGAVLNPTSNGVKVRPDFASCFGDIMAYKDGKGNIKYPKSEEYQAIYDKVKNERISNLYGHYEGIIHNIMADAEKGKPEAILAYFMYRTKVRAGSNQNPKADDGRGATTLYTGDISVNGETVYCNFPAKNGFWHISLEDKFLADFCKKRKEELKGAEGKNSTPFFGVSYSKLNNYLKDISAEFVGGDRDMAFRPHNFRHFAATSIVKQYVDKFADGVDYEKEPEKFETAVCKGVSAAAGVLNDTPDVVFEKYVIPQIAFSGNESFMKKHYKFLNADTSDKRLKGKGVGDGEENDD